MRRTSAGFNFHRGMIIPPPKSHVSIQKGNPTLVSKRHLSWVLYLNWEDATVPPNSPLCDLALRCSAAPLPGPSSPAAARYSSLQAQNTQSSWYLSPPPIRINDAPPQLFVFIFQSLDPTVSKHSHLCACDAAPPGFGHARTASAPLCSLSAPHRQR